MFVLFLKLDRVGPVDKRRPINKLHIFVRKRRKKKLHVTHDMWHATHDMWIVVWGEYSLKTFTPQLFRFMTYDILKIWRKRLTHWKNKSITKVFVE